MRVEELRIGNLVKTYLHPPISEWLNINVSVATLEDLAVAPNSIEPILLTEGWLVRFGFKREGVLFDWAIKIQDNKWIGYDFDTNRVGVAFIHPSLTRDIPLIDCKYVHQLQNLYYALTNTELKIKE